MDDNSSQTSESEYVRELVSDDPMELETFFFNSKSEFKYVQTHASITNKCTTCENKSVQHLKISYSKRCASSKCHDTASKTMCPVRYKVIFCLNSNTYFIDKLANVEHLNIFPNNIDKPHGMHLYFTKEITRLLDEQKRAPKILHNILIVNKNRGLYDLRYPLPTYEQVKHFVYNSYKDDYSNELGNIQEFGRCEIQFN